jgi:hypothetical protein
VIDGDREAEIERALAFVASHSITLGKQPLVDLTRVLFVMAGVQIRAASLLYAHQDLGSARVAGPGPFSQQLGAGPNDLFGGYQDNHKRSSLSFRARAED